MRAVPHQAAEEAIATLSDALKMAVCDLVGCGISLAAWEQATLPITQGGLGIRDPSSCWQEARIAALVNFHKHAANVGLPRDVLDSTAPDQADLLVHLSTMLGPNQDPIHKW
jgi:hypothetical protein